MAARCAYDYLDGEDLVVTVERSVKLNLDIKMDPDFVAILEVKLNGAIGKEEVNVDANTILEVSENVANVDTEDAHADANLEGIGVNVASDLWIRIVRMSHAQMSEEKELFTHLDRAETPVDGHAAGSIARGQVEDLVNLLGLPDVLALFRGGEADDSTFENSVLVPKSWSLV